MADANLDATEVDESENNVSNNSDDISHLLERINDLEKTVNKIEEQQADITHKIKSQSESISDIEESIDDLRSNFNDLSDENDVQESRMNNINKILDTLEENIENTRGDMKEENRKIKQQLEAIENMMDIDKKDIAKAVKPDACELEQLSTIPEASRKDQFTVRVQRAIALYENFNRISTPVKGGGKRVISKDIKTFLNGYSDNNIKYTQVQRVIDSFDEKTGSEYQVQNTGDGRAIIWNTDN